MGVGSGGGGVAVGGRVAVADGVDLGVRRVVDTLTVPVAAAAAVTVIAFID